MTLAVCLEHKRLNGLVKSVKAGGYRPQQLSFMEWSQANAMTPESGLEIYPVLISQIENEEAFE